ncbi:MAG: FeoA family protein [Candidatus Borkfalkiaceae bacterium]|nr:FeoA family protein [Christensenellaceae bacterium]
MPIVLAPLNHDLRIVRIVADEKLKKHLESLGITVNGEITVLSASGGSVVCKIKEGRIALDKELSTKIFVA